jgi:hypothetical protein
MRRLEFESGTGHRPSRVNCATSCVGIRLRNPGLLIFNACDAHFVVLLVRNVAKRCTSTLPGRRVRSVVSVQRSVRHRNATFEVRMSKVSRRTVLKAGTCALVATAGIRQVTHANAETGPSSKHQEIVQRIDPALASLAGGFVSETATVNATSLHYVRGGQRALRCAGTAPGRG